MDNVKQIPIKIQESNLVKKRIKKSKYNKFQNFICKIIKVEPLDEYEYLFKIRYLGKVRLKSNDIIVNSEKVMFVVIQEANRIAMIATIETFTKKPKVYGTIHKLEVKT